MAPNLFNTCYGSAPARLIPYLDKCTWRRTVARRKRKQPDRGNYD